MKPTLLRSKPTSKRISIASFAQHLAAALFAAATLSANAAAQTAPPPNFGDETKGEPAIEESAQANSSNTPSSEASKEIEEQTTGGISRATVVESRRESGQVYSIELQHSNAPNQYIEETDSDGNIEYQSNDLEETPNLPKWKIGSW